MTEQSLEIAVQPRSPRWTPKKERSLRCPGCGELKLEEKIYCTNCGTDLPRP